RAGRGDRDSHARRSRKDQDPFRDPVGKGVPPAGQRHPRRAQPRAWGPALPRGRRDAGEPDGAPAPAASRVRDDHPDRPGPAQPAVEVLDGEGPGVLRPIGPSWTATGLSAPSDSSFRAGVCSKICTGVHIGGSVLRATFVTLLAGFSTLAFGQAPGVTPKTI